MAKTTSTTAEISLFDGAILRRAAGQAFAKLNPRGLMRNPVIFVTGLTSVLVTILVIRDGLIVEGRLYMEPVEMGGGDIAAAVQELYKAPSRSAD